MSMNTNLAADIAVKAGTAFKIKSEECETLNANQKSTAQSYDRLAQVVTLESSRTFFQLGDDAELDGSAAAFGNEIYIAPNGKTEMFILPANKKISGNRMIALIIYGI